METINTLFMITAGFVAVIGIVLFVVGLIWETPFKWVFLMIGLLGIAGRTILPPDIYKQAKAEGIVWLTVLNNGDLDKARAEHQQGLKNINEFLDSGDNHEVPYIANDD